MVSYLLVYAYVAYALAVAGLDGRRTWGNFFVAFFLPLVLPFFFIQAVWEKLKLDPVFTLRYKRPWYRNVDLKKAHRRGNWTFIPEKHARLGRRSSTPWAEWSGFSCRWFAVGYLLILSPENMRKEPK